MHPQDVPYHMRHATAPLQFVDTSFDDLLQYLDDGILHRIMGDLDDVQRKEAELMQWNMKLAQQVTQMSQQVTQMTQQQMELRSFVQCQARR